MSEPLTDLAATLQAQAANYRALGYSNDDTLFTLLEACTQRWPDKHAIVWGEGSMTFAQWHDRSLRLATALRRLGVEKTHLPDKISRIQVGDHQHVPWFRFVFHHD